MAAKKGNKYSPGRSKGTKNAKTLQWEALGKSLLENHASRANKILQSCDDDVFMDNYTKLLEYFKPKQARAEVKITDDSEVNITFRHAE